MAAKRLKAGTNTKRPATKLQVSKQTLRDLSAGRASAVRGGASKLSGGASRTPTDPTSTGASRT